MAKDRTPRGAGRGNRSEGRGSRDAAQRGGPARRQDRSGKGGGASGRGGKPRSGGGGKSRSGGSGKPRSGGGSPRGGRAQKPPIPEDVPRVAGPVWRDIDAATAPGLAPEVARAVSGAAELAESDPQRATALLGWAKKVAPRSAAVREALGVDAYRRGDFQTAASELGAYRRLSGRQDQNHLLADSLRATGHGDRVRELVEAMGEDVNEERRLEAHLVHAGMLADAGDVLRAREVLERAGGEPRAAGPQHLRLWYLAAELSLELGDRRHAVELLHAVVTLDPDFLDAAERLVELDEWDADDEATDADDEATDADDPPPSATA